MRCLVLVFTVVCLISACSFSGLKDESGYLDELTQDYSSVVIAKIEERGNENYPENIKGFYGKGRFKLGVYLDGSIRSVEITESSGNDTLDNYIIRVVRGAAPFPIFSKDLRGKFDFIEITHPFVFSEDNET